MSTAPVPRCPRSSPPAYRSRTLASDVRCSWLEDAPERRRRLGRGPALLPATRHGWAAATPRRRRRPGRCWRSWPPANGPPSSSRGIRYLVDTQRPDGGWDEDRYTGTGFPGDFYIAYHLYRLVFPIWALGRVPGSARTPPGPAGRTPTERSTMTSDRLYTAALGVARPARRGRRADLTRTGRAAGSPPGGPILVAGVAGALSDDLAPRRPGRGHRGPRQRPRARARAAVRRGTAADECPAAVTACGSMRDRSSPSTGSSHGQGRREQLGCARRRRRGHRVGAAGLRRRHHTRAPRRRRHAAAPAAAARHAGPRGSRALAALRRAAPVDRRLGGGRRTARGAARRPALVLRRRGARHRGRRARPGAASAPPVYVRRQIVHNRHVVEDLERRGAVFVEEADEVPEGSVLVLAAHGVAPVGA